MATKHTLRCVVPVVTVMAVMGWHFVETGLSAQRNPPTAAPSADRLINQYAQRMIDQGRQIFRTDTFGSEAFWGDALQLHKAIAGEKNGGVGGGVSPKTALSVGLKVDADVLPAALQQQIKDGKVDLDDPATTLALLKLNAVVGVKGPSTTADVCGRWASNAPFVTPPLTIPSRLASASAWTGGPTAI